jgi:hypothetical protein
MAIGIKQIFRKPVGAKNNTSFPFKREFIASSWWPLNES